ncbi:hypothetical protein [Thermococcus prieurii]
MRRGGIHVLALGIFLLVLLVAGTITVLAMSGKITLNGSEPKKTAGRIVKVGAFNSSVSALKVVNVNGDVSIVPANVSEVLIKSNLPVRASVQNGALTVYCPAKHTHLGGGTICDDYRNGTVIVEVPKKLDYVKVENVVGTVYVGVNATSVGLSDIVGTIKGRAWADYRVSNIVGNVYINVMERATVSDVVGNVVVAVPPGKGAVLKARNVMGNVINDATRNGSVEVSVNDVVGNVEVGG